MPVLRQNFKTLHCLDSKTETERSIRFSFRIDGQSNSYRIKAHWSRNDIFRDDYDFIQPSYTAVEMSIYEPPVIAVELKNRSSGQTMRVAVADEFFNIFRNVSNLLRLISQIGTVESE
jgi:hypothetical protein